MKIISTVYCVAHQVLYGSGEALLAKGPPSSWRTTIPRIGSHRRACQPIVRGGTLQLLLADNPPGRWPASTLRGCPRSASVGPVAEVLLCGGPRRAVVHVVATVWVSRVNIVGLDVVQCRALRYTGVVLAGRGAAAGISRVLQARPSRVHSAVPFLSCAVSCRRGTAHAFGRCPSVLRCSWCPNLNAAPKLLLASNPPSR